MGTGWRGDRVCLFGRPVGGASVEDAAAAKRGSGWSAAGSRRGRCPLVSSSSCAIRCASSSVARSVYAHPAPCVFSHECVFIFDRLSWYCLLPEYNRSDRVCLYNVYRVHPSVRFGRWSCVSNGSRNEFGKFLKLTYPYAVVRTFYFRLSCGPT